MEFPSEMFLGPVKGHDDLFQFRYDFTLEGKSVDDQPQAVVTETDDGDLLIEGYAAVFDGMDRSGENFAEGAFQRGIKSFLAGQAGLCFHHKHDKCLGKVLELREVEGKGLWMKARVDAAIKTHPEFGTYYQQIKRGTLNALSVGGFFKRALTAAGQKIVDMDFTEISVTPVPVHPGTNFAVVAGKALADVELGAGENAPSDDDVRTQIMEAEEVLRTMIAGLDNIFTKIIESRQPKDESETSDEVEDNLEPQVETQV